jgi:hypothetical protein
VPDLQQNPDVDLAIFCLANRTSHFPFRRDSPITTTMMKSLALLLALIASCMAFAPNQLPQGTKDNDHDDDVLATRLRQPMQDAIDPT